MNSVRLLRRINLGNYQHWEVEVIIDDADENMALKRTVALMNKALECVGQPLIDVRKVD